MVAQLYDHGTFNVKNGVMIPLALVLLLFSYLVLVADGFFRNVPVSGEFRWRGNFRLAFAQLTPTVLTYLGPQYVRYKRTTRKAYI